MIFTVAPTKFEAVQIKKKKRINKKKIMLYSVSKILS